MSSGLLKEVPPGAAILLALIITVPCGFVVANMVTSYREKIACEVVAARWEAANQNGEVYRAPNAPHFAKQYNAFRNACPNGHMLVDESKIPAAIKAGYRPAKK